MAGADHWPASQRPAAIQPRSGAVRGAAHTPMWHEQPLSPARVRAKDVPRRAALGGGRCVRCEYPIVRQRRETPLDNATIAPRKANAESAPMKPGCRNENK